jgi:hypothetical protein
MRSVLHRRETATRMGLGNIPATRPSREARCPAVESAGGSGQVCFHEVLENPSAVARRELSSAALLCVDFVSDRMTGQASVGTAGRRRERGTSGISEEEERRNKEDGDEGGGRFVLRCQKARRSWRCSSSCS